ncbi:MAG TPA: HNH endonuclease signature motif containing protein [Bosea sp. (in: a-proteobacteria)]
MNALPALADLQEAMEYDALTGVFTWRRRDDRQNNWNAVYPGAQAGWLDGKGYLRITWDGVKLGLHRIAWKFLTGEDPAVEVDHENGIRSDNRASNLRLATTSQNRMNMRARGEWPKGVYKNKRGKFVAQIKCRGQMSYLGSFTSPEAAHQAYAARAHELFGEFRCIDR